MHPVSVKRPEGPRTASSTAVTTMRTEDLVAALFLYALERVGEGRECLAISLSNDGVNNNNGLFVAHAGAQMGGVCSSWRGGGSI
jgi:hypothetical protein